MVIFSKHSVRRWRERFPDLDMDLIYANSKRCGKKTKRKVANSCPGHSELWRGGFKGKYLRIAKHWIVFVIAPPETVITVLDFRREAK